MDSPTSSCLDVSFVARRLGLQISVWISREVHTVFVRGDDARIE